MLRIGSMNMLLHGVENPDIRYRDSLAQADVAGAGATGTADDAEKYSLILANPPFAGSLDYESTAKDLQLAALECSSDLHPRFLLRWFQHSSPARLIANPSYPSIRISDIRSEQIPLPPLTEQKRIAGILDAADALRAKRRESIAQLDTLLQSTFLDMFGDPIGNEWEMATVADVADNEKGAIRTGPFGSQLLHSEFVDEGIRVLGIDNASANEFREGEPRFITPRKYEQLRRYTVRPGDVLIRSSSRIRVEFEAI